MDSFFSQSILVLGGGQLGLMLAESAAHLGIGLDRVDTVTDQLIPGTSLLRLPTGSNELACRYSVITAEMEHLPETGLVRHLRQSTAWANKKSFDILPSRQRQKELLDDIGVANAPWCLLDSRDAIDQAHRALGDPLIVKTVRGGYDGKGQWVIRKGISNAIPPALFGQLIAEKEIRFHREVSLVGARTSDGNTTYFPLTENHHHKGILRYSFAPINDPANLQQKAEQMLGMIMSELDYVGVMAMECFDSGTGLIVNELAPRVHNSGHWTQSGSAVSQFDLHIRALAGLPFPCHLTFDRTLMLNLIGCEYNPRWNEFDGVYCYWYRKERRDNRKLGHINLKAGTDAQLAQRVEQLRPLLDQEHRQLLDRGARHVMGIRET